jgi:hypothetical protein
LITGITALLIVLVCAVLSLCFLIWKLNSHISGTVLSVSSLLNALTPVPPNSSSPSEFLKREGRLPIRLDSGLHLRYGSPGAYVELFPCALPDVDTLKLLDLPETAKGNVLDFVLDTAHVYGEASGVRTLAIRFSPEVARQLKNGQLELMKSALSHKPCAIDPNNAHRIVELGDIVSSINPVAAVAFVWQILAVITAKKFLADINSKLADIGREIHDIRSFLIDAEESELIANHDYLVQVTQSVLNGNLGPEDVVVIGTQMEDIERQSSRTMHVMLKSEHRRMEGIRPEHGKSFFEKDFNQCIDYSRRETEAFYELSRVCLLALAVRSAATYIRAALPLNKVIARNRLIRIQDDFDSYTKVKSEFAKRIHSLNETMMARRLSPNDESQFIQRGKENVDEVLLRLDSKCLEVQNGIDAVRGAINDNSGTDVVYAQVDGKKVILFNTTEKSEFEDC